MIIYIDSAESKTKILNADSSPRETTKLVSVAIPKTMMDVRNVSEILEIALSTYVTGKGKFRSSSATVVLPNSFVGFDILTLPNISKRHMADAFNTEYRLMYKNYEQLIMRSEILSATKKTTTYILYMIQKQVVEDINKTLSKYNLKVDNISFTAACLRESLGNLDSKLAKKDFLLVNVGKQSTDIVMCAKERVLGGAELPFGLNILYDDKVVNQSLVNVDTIAELLVINAKERAKAKKLTMALDIDGDDDDEENVEREVSDINLNNQIADGENNPIYEAAMPTKQDMLAMAREMQKEESERLSNSDGDDDFEEEFVQEEVTIKTLRKKERRLPSFMQRPLPETEDGFVIENFRIIYGKIMQYVRYCRLSEQLPSYDKVVVALPQQMSFLVEYMTAEEKREAEENIFGTHKKTEFVFFANDGSNNEVNASIIVPYGAYFLDKANASQRF